jgi:hypothetical protein
MAAALAAAVGASCGSDRRGPVSSNPDSATHCGDALPPEPAATPFALRFDQVGYEADTPIWGVALGAGQPAPRYRIYDLTSSCWIGSGHSTAGPRLLETTSRAGTPLTGDRITLTGTSGTPDAPRDYLVVLEDGTRSAPIRVGGRPYAAPLERLVRFLRVQRCGPTTPAISRHGACHLFASLSDRDPATLSGDGVAVDDGTTADITADSGPAVDVEGGWHDAGDHIKFMGTTAFMLAVDLIALRDRRAALEAAVGAPTVADLRAEMRWGLDWVVKMLGGDTMYHQVSGARDHEGPFRLPEGDTAHPAPGYAHRPVFRFAPGCGANILGRAAAALAVGSQVFADDPAYAARLLALARRVFTEAQARPQPQNPDPPNFYHEGSVGDDLALGAAALARATGEAAYRDQALSLARALDSDAGSPLYWGGVEGLALLETAELFPDASPERAALAAQLAALAAPIAATATAARGPGAAFAYALDDFGNGTIAQSLGAAAVCLATRRLGGDASCIEVARNQLHWLFGRNPFGLSYQVGSGVRYPAHPHHSFASTAGILLDGALVGGPTAADVIDGLVPVPTAADPFARWSTDGLLYEDVEADYVVNEPALDFTAPFLFVIGELAAEPTR